MKDLIQFATVRQIEYIEAIEKYGSQRKAAEALGVSRRVVDRSMIALKTKAAKQDAKQHDYTKTVPEGFSIKGVSQYIDKDGKVAGQWVKTNADSDNLEKALTLFAETLSESVKGLAPIVKPPVYSNNDLMCVYPMGDPHFGMYAWWKEVGDDFDVNIAEKLTKGAIDRLVSSAPDAEIGMLLNLGDMFHADNQSNISQSGHQLDVDGRWTKVQQAGLMAMIYCINRLLDKHKNVIVRINKGNHDGHSSKALAMMLWAYFHNETRVEVDLSPAICWYYRFGKVLIGSTHGDTIKGPNMVSLMAADKPEDWGKTKHRYWYVGHVHHQDVKEYPGGIVEYFRTLAARDAWHAGQGYRAGRDMRLIVLHSVHGEVERHRVDIGMI